MFIHTSSIPSFQFDNREIPMKIFSVAHEALFQANITKYL